MITGARGLIGRPILDLLAGTADSIHAVTSRTIAVKATDAQGVIWHSADLRLPSLARSLIETIQPTHLVHLAWYTVHGRFWESPENIPWLQGSLELIRAFAESGQRLVTVGSCAEYDWQSGWCVEASTGTLPATLYGACKLSLANVSRALAAQHEVSAAHARVFQLYGAAESPDRLVASVIDACLKGEEARCTDGSQLRDFLHAADVAGAIIALLNSETTGAVNIGGGHPVLVSEIVASIGHLTGRGDLIRLGAIPRRPGEPALLLPHVGRLLDEVRWRPTLTLSEGLRLTIAERSDRLRLQADIP